MVPVASPPPTRLPLVHTLGSTAVQLVNSVVTLASALLAPCGQDTTELINFRFVPFELTVVIRVKLSVISDDPDRAHWLLLFVTPKDPSVRLPYDESLILRTASTPSSAS